MYYKLRSYLSIIRYNLEDNIKLGIFDKIKLFSKGFRNDKYELYGFKYNSMDDYMSDVDHSNSRFINGNYKFILDNKVLFESLYKNDFKIPETLGIIKKGIVYDSFGEEISLNDILKISNKIIIKPIEGTRGEGISLIELGITKVLVNGEKKDLIEINKIISRLENYYISEYINQNEYSKKIFPNATNTIRIVVGKKDGNNPFIIGASHRFGSLKTYGIDNLATGGLVSGIDLETGKLGKLKRIKKIKRSIKLESFSMHPDTGEKVEGIVIPNWEIIKEKVLIFTRKVVYLEYFGLDILISSDGDIVLIEINNHPEPYVLQLNEPILRSRENRSFFKKYI